eukprot:8659233-Pyramimonas_sp.AAC.1
MCMQSLWLRESEQHGAEGPPPIPQRPDTPWRLASRNANAREVHFPSGNRAHPLTQRLFA